MLSESAIERLIKYAAKEKKEVKEYRKRPSKANKEKLIRMLEEAEEDNPTHMQGGYYKDTKMALDRAEEMTDRGNKIRGALTKYLGVPYYAITDTLFSPVRAIGRAVSPNTNLAFHDVEDLKDIEDPEKVIRAANELAGLLEEDRPDPTKNWEGIKNFTKNFKNNTESMVSDTVAQVATGGVPVIMDLASDVVNTPHTLLFNKLEWNGDPREEYVKRKKKEKDK